MREFFKGWRRKVGCAALVMAVVLMSLWIRTRLTVDHIHLVTRDRTYYVTSCLGGIVLGSADGSHKPMWKFDWTLGDVSNYSRHKTPAAFAADWSKAAEEFHPWVMTMLYWQLVLPLTLLSAWLNLWPRRRLPSIGGQSDA